MPDVNPVDYATQPDPEQWLLALGALEGGVWPQGQAALLQALTLLHPELVLRWVGLAVAGAGLGAAAGWGFGVAANQLLLPNLPLLGPLIAPGLAALPGMLVLPGLVFAVMVALGFSPIPLCFVAWAAGFLGLAWPVAIGGLVMGHGLRLLILGWILWRGGVRQVARLERDWHGLTLVVSMLGLVLFLLVAFAWRAL